MTNNILIGEKSGVTGLFVSRPGVAVETAGENDLIMSPNRKFLQVMHERTVTVSRAWRPGFSHVLRRVDHPNFGIVPLVVIEIDALDSSRYAPFSRFPFGQTPTGFWLLRPLALDRLDDPPFNPSGTVTIKLYNVPLASGFAKPSADIEEADN